MLPFALRIRTGVPISEQVVFAVTRAVVSGRLKPGDRFPSVRELSKELKIHPNTAQSILSSLVQRKLLEIEPGIGSRVALIPTAAPEVRQAFLEEELERIAVEAARIGVSKVELLEATEKMWNQAIGGKSDE